VKTPLELMLPALADHVTARLAEPLPCNVALHCEVAPGAIDAGAQDTETDDTVLATEVAMCCEPPQAAQHSRIVLAAKTHATLRPRISSLAFMHGSNRSLHAPAQKAHSAAQGTLRLAVLPGFP